MPMVVMKEGVKESSLKRRRQHDFPTPESPISRSFICAVRCLLVEEVQEGDGEFAFALKRGVARTRKS